MFIQLSREKSQKRWKLGSILWWLLKLNVWFMMQMCDAEKVKKAGRVGVFKWMFSDIYLNNLCKTVFYCILKNKNKGNLRDAKYNRNPPWNVLEINTGSTHFNKDKQIKITILFTFCTVVISATATTC